MSLTLALTLPGAVPLARSLADRAKMAGIGLTSDSSEPRVSVSDAELKRVPDPTARLTKTPQAGPVDRNVQLKLGVPTPFRGGLLNRGVPEELISGFGVRRLPLRFRTVFQFSATYQFAGRRWFLNRPCDTPCDMGGGVVGEITPVHVRPAPPLTQRLFFGHLFLVRFQARMARTPPKPVPMVTALQAAMGRSTPRNAPSSAKVTPVTSSVRPGTETASL